MIKKIVLKDFSTIQDLVYVRAIVEQWFKGKRPLGTPGIVITMLNDTEFSIQETQRKITIRKL